MTDHNAEGGKKVEPCAWCGREPEVDTGEDPLSGRPPEPNDVPGYGCYNPQCVCSYLPDLPLPEWSYVQNQILATRRRDFEAGQISMLVSHTVDEFDDYITRDRE